MKEKEGNSKRSSGISKSLRRFFGVGDMGLNLMTNIETYYFQFFLTDIAKFALPIVTLISTVSSLVDAALSWAYGAFLNTMKPMKWGRYRSWLAVIPWLVPFLYAFQFIKLNDGVAAVVIIIIATITSHIAWNIPFVANISMINIAAKTPEDRMALSSTRAVWATLGMVLYSYVGPGTVAILASVVGAENSYGAAAFVFGVLMAAGYFAHFKMFEGYEETGAEDRSLLFYLCRKAAGTDSHIYPGFQSSGSCGIVPFKKCSGKGISQKYRNIFLYCHGSGIGIRFCFLQQYMGSARIRKYRAVFLHHDKCLCACALR